MKNDVESHIKELEEELGRKLNEHEIVLGRTFYNAGRISELEKAEIKLNRLLR